MEYRTKRTAELSALQLNPEQIRNICVLAHVDHGKTTLSDSLISYNNIISHKQAGQLRFMDDREDEQERLITMKASAISIIYQQPSEPTKYVVNLIDSPGHVDFSFEVSSALRLSDGALVLVDALESVCQQTVTVIRQAWDEKVKMCLVINKIDRLPSSLNMSPLDGYNHIKGIIQQVNALLSSLISMHINVMIANDPNMGKMREELVAKMEEECYFSPEKGNVAFASAIDCWGFTIDSYSDFISGKLGVDKSVTKQFLWGDFCFSPSKKQFIKLDGSAESAEKAAFVNIVLAPLWKEYSKVQPLKGSEDTSTYKETRSKIRDRLSKTLPLDKCILALICKHLPSPKVAQKIRLPTLCPGLFTPEGQKSVEWANLRTAIENVDNSDTAPVVVYVSKMMPIDKMQISDLKDTVLGESAATEERLALIGFARVFSGRLNKGKKVFVIGPKHSKEHGIIDIHEIVLEHLYTLTGMHLDVTELLPAGSVGGLGGLDWCLYKTGTISTSPDCLSFIALSNKSKPIVKVALEAKKLSDMEKLADGLKKLNKADPSVEVYLTESGEYILCTCGEVHLQKCIKDLNDDYAKVPFTVSEPIVNFRETITLKYMKQEKVKTEKEKQKAAAALNHVAGKEKGKEKEKLAEEEKAKKNEVEEDKKTSEKLTLYLEKLRHLKDTKQKGLAIDTTPNGRCRIYIRAVGLDFEVTKWLEANHSTIKKIAAKQLSEAETREFVQKFKAVLLEHSTPKKVINLILGYMASFGPKKNGPNIIVSPFMDHTQSLLYSPGESSPDLIRYRRNLPAQLFQHVTFEEFQRSMVAGFELATLSSPLCEEKMVGACFIVEAIDYIDVKLEYDTYGPFAGQIMSTVRVLCRKAFMNADPRLVEGLYMCTMQVSSGTLGKIYTVINKRRGRRVSEELLAETDLFTVRVLIPVIESFGFTEEIRERGEGITDPQLTFSHWEIISQDPFFVAKTAEQREEFGEQTQAPTLAKMIIDKVRKRKGLPTEVKLVAYADKQRTLTKMK